VNLALLRRLACVPDLEIDLVTSALVNNLSKSSLRARRIFKVPVNNRNIHHSSNRELLTYAALAHAGPAQHSGAPL